MKLKTVAIIPARGGSKGVPDKNIRLLSGAPLIAYSIVAARLSDSIDRVVVSTDSEVIANIARTFGAEVPFLRPSEISQDQSTDLEFMKHFINWLVEHNAQVPELVIHLRPTTPLRQPELIDRAIRHLTSNPLATSLRSGHECPESPFKWFTRGDTPYWHPISPSMEISACNLPRQKFPKVYIPNGYVDIVKPEFFMHHQDLHGSRILPFLSPVASEIDTIEDFNRIEFETQTFVSPILAEINKCLNHGSK